MYELIWLELVLYYATRFAWLEGTSNIPLFPLLWHIWQRLCVWNSLVILPFVDSILLLFLYSRFSLVHMHSAPRVTQYETPPSKKNFKHFFVSFYQRILTWIAVKLTIVTKADVLTIWSLNISKIMLLLQILWHVMNEKGSLPISLNSHELEKQQ